MYRSRQTGEEPHGGAKPTDPILSEASLFLTRFPFLFENNPPGFMVSPATGLFYNLIY